MKIKIPEIKNELKWKFEKTDDSHSNSWKEMKVRKKIMMSEEFAVQNVARRN